MDDQQNTPMNLTIKSQGIFSKIILIDNGGLYPTGGQKIFGTIPPYVRKLELNLHSEISTQEIRRVIKKFHSDSQILLLKINLKV